MLQLQSEKIRLVAVAQIILYITRLNSDKFSIYEE